MHDESYVSDLEEQLEKIILDKESSPVDLLIVLYLDIVGLSTQAKNEYMKSAIDVLNDALGGSDRVKVVGLTSNENKIDYIPIKVLLTSENIEDYSSIKKSLDRLLEHIISGKKD